MGRGEEFRPVSILVEASVSGEGGEGGEFRPVYSGGSKCEWGGW